MNMNFPSLFRMTGSEPCTGQDVFFPDDYQKAADVVTAKALCASCPSLQVCRSWALDHPTFATHGIWGGFTPQERKMHRRLFRAGDDHCSTTAA
ncbi:hypothetical protein GCM10010330_79470 [Streptomyces tendae]|nr:hypothetical protein GCM10010330_79470 [Streptomyces tendae]